MDAEKGLKDRIARVLGITLFVVLLALGLRFLWFVIVLAFKISVAIIATLVAVVALPVLVGLVVWWILRLKRTAEV